MLALTHPHTPSPWGVDDELGIFAETSGATICQVQQADDFPCLEEGTEDDVQAECVANAYVIMIAPETAALIRRLIKWDTDFPVNSHNGYAGLKELDKIIADGKAILDKAGMKHVEGGL